VHRRNPFVEEQLIDRGTTRRIEILVFPRVAHVGIRECVSVRDDSTADVTDATRAQRIGYRQKG
jgi:hypothetical protein